MKTKNKQIAILAFLILILFAINYSFFDSLLINFLDGTETVVVERVIDGDTIVIENKTSVRLLGINSPEKTGIYYEEAKEFLEDLILGKDVRFEFGKEKYDKYNRVLAYVFVGNKNVNLELVEKGFANFYFPSGKDMYYEDFKKAWEKCSENLCEKSQDKCVNCIELQKFDYKNEVVVFYNKCDFDCDLTGWEIKDEGRKNFVFPEYKLSGKKSVNVKVVKKLIENSEKVPPQEQGMLSSGQEVLLWQRSDYVWTDSGDTLFLRDSEGKLVLWKSY